MSCRVRVRTTRKTRTRCTGGPCTVANGCFRLTSPPPPKETWTLRDSGVPKSPLLKVVGDSSVLLRHYSHRPSLETRKSSNLHPHCPSTGVIFVFNPVLGSEGGWGL